MMEGRVVDILAEMGEGVGGSGAVERKRCTVVG